MNPVCRLIKQWLCGHDEKQLVESCRNTENYQRYAIYYCERCDREWASTQLPDNNRHRW